MPTTVLISGASRGLGLATARELAARGYRVFAGVRARGALPTGSGAMEVLLDVTSQSSVERAVREVSRDGGGIDVLINNAGKHAFGAMETADEARFRALLEVNLLGAWRLTREVLPGMRARGGGHVLMVSSLSGKVGLPGDGQYTASKFALEGMTESLALEVQRFGIRVTLLDPGPYDTDMLHIEASPPARRASRAGADAYAPMHQALLSRRRRGEPAENAARVIAGVVAHPPADLRVPVGSLAERIFEDLDIDPGERGKRVALAATGLDWWTRGEEPE